jgi:hypothetical protein
MSSQQIQLALWVSQPLLQGTIGLLLYRRRLHKQFPAFFAYFAAQIVFFVISFPISHNSWLYFDVYWASVAMNAVFAFKIIHEVFADVFRPFPALKDLGTALFKWAAMIMILLSVVMISLSPDSDQPLIRTILVVQRCVDVIQCGMVIFLLAFCHSLGVSWKRPSFGIVLGFGLFSAAELLILALYSGLHVRSDVTGLVSLVSYEASLFLWVGYSLLQAREANVPVLVPQRWDDALMEIQPHKEGESLIPMFEHMVEQAFSKTQNQSL